MHVQLRNHGGCLRAKGGHPASQASAAEKGTSVQTVMRVQQLCTFKTLIAIAKFKKKGSYPVVPGQYSVIEKTVQMPSGHEVNRPA
jgi:hypothetical protein